MTILKFTTKFPSLMHQKHYSRQNDFRLGMYIMRLHIRSTMDIQSMRPIFAWYNPLLTFQYYFAISQYVSNSDDEPEMARLLQNTFSFIRNLQHSYFNRPGFFLLTIMRKIFLIKKNITAASYHFLCSLSQPAYNFKLK